MKKDIMQKKWKTLPGILSVQRQRNMNGFWLKVKEKKCRHAPKIAFARHTSVTYCGCSGKRGKESQEAEE